MAGKGIVDSYLGGFQMDIEVERSGDEIVAVRISGVEFHSDDGETWVIPKSYLRTVKTVSLPRDLQIECCESVQENVVQLDTIPYRIRRMSRDRVHVEFEEMERRKFWDHSVGLKKYMETKRDIIAQRAQQVGDVSLDSYEDDGDYIFLHYSAIITGTEVGQVIDQAEQLIAEIDGATELEVGAPLPPLDELHNEREFALSIVIPLLRKLGFLNVKYNHGKREFGRDILFARLTEFGELEFWGAQVKYGNVSGEAKSEIDEMIGQFDDAFKMPFYDVYTRKKQHISKLLIVVSGRFTENAVEKLCEKIESAAIRNNLVFLDGERITTIAEKFRRL